VTFGRRATGAREAVEDDGEISEALARTFDREMALELKPLL
jgi:hypothetical protein